MDRFLGVGKGDPRPLVGVAFGHFLLWVDEGHHFGEFGLNVPNFGEKGRPELLVEPSSVFICEFYVLQLVDSHGYVCRLVQKNVHSHQDWVGVESDAAVLVGLLLVLDHRIQPVLWPQATQDPRELAVGWHLRLHKETHFGRVDARSQQYLGHGERVCSDLLVEADSGVLVGECGGEGVEVGNHEVLAVVGGVLLKFEHVGD